ncbi:hypothetical protein HXX76_011711 [Chlamydomonas incerta]|uniref:Uncharacterized protein n=1 Tax=Chlamydomonas incerta TaxID=51695 RepID=A0A835SK68_CHLIN|nr:hypothetical protein HXX76_011711 [Chlamydomonas incerta]|eukprot:KAG2426482.1 hypothetical protein HXX76_011711 [Chlamydomonas incerta]
MALQGSLQEALGCIDEVARDLVFYETPYYKPGTEQAVLAKCQATLEKCRPVLIANAEAITNSDWRKIATLVGPLAHCLIIQATAQYASSAKARHSAASAVAVLASLSSTTERAKVILAAALEAGVVDAFVGTLRHSLRHPNPDRVVRAMLYKMIDTLMGLACYASLAHQQVLVSKDVVDVCLELLTSGATEPESKLLASKTLYNVLATPPGGVVAALRTSKVTALNAQLQQLAGLVPDPVSAATSALAPGAANKAISMPPLLAAIMTWVWFLPDYILDHLIESLTSLLARVVVLVWPEGCPGIPVRGGGGAGGGSGGGAGGEEGGGGEAKPVAGPLQAAQQSLPNRSLRQTLTNCFAALCCSAVPTDPRLARCLRGSRLPGRQGGPEEYEAGMGALGGSPGPGVYDTALPARLVRVLLEGRPDGMEVKVALELIDELFAAAESASSAAGAAAAAAGGGSGGGAGAHPAAGGGPNPNEGLADALAEDCLSAGLLRAMSDLAVFPAMRTEAGLQGLSAYVRLSSKLVKRAAASTAGLTPGTPGGLAARLRDSGVPASVAYIAFWPGGKLGLKLEALMTLHELVQLDVAAAEAVVALPNFAVALANTLLGGDPETRKPPKKSGGKNKGGGGGGGGGRGGGGGGADGGGTSAANEANRSLRDQIQDASLDVLSVVLDVSRESDKVWQSLVESGLLSRLLQHVPSFPMAPGLTAELVGMVGTLFREHGAEEEVAALGALQAACVPHLLPLLTHEDGAVQAAAARLLRSVVEDCVRYRRDSVDVEQGDDILRALLAAGPGIDTADAVAAQMAARAAAAAAAAAGTAAAGGGGGNGVKAEPGAEGAAAAAAAPGSAAAAVKMDVDGAAPAAAPAGPGSAEAGAAAGAGAVKPEPEAATAAAPSSGGKGSGGKAAAAAGEPGTRAGTAEPEEAPELVDVTAQGLGIMCAALQASLAAAQAAHIAAARGSPSKAGGAAAAPVPVPLGFEPESLGQLRDLLLTVAALAEAVAGMPAQGHVRRHVARAFAHAAPAVAELSACLQVTFAAQPGGVSVSGLDAWQHGELAAAAARAGSALAAVPVLDVALLPKPKSDEEEEEKAAGAANNRKRAAVSNKRASKEALGAAAAAAAADGVNPGAGGAAAAPPAKRQRTASLAAREAAAAAAAEAEAEAAAAAAVAAGVQRFRSSGGSPLLAAHRTSSGAIDGGAGLLPSLPSGVTRIPPALARAAVGAGGGLPLAGMGAVRAPPPAGGAGSGLLDRSPSTSVDGIGIPRVASFNNGAPGSATAAAAAAAAANAGGARPSVADFKARFMDMKNLNAKLTQELEAARRRAETAETAARQVSAVATARTGEIERLKAQLAAAQRQTDALSASLAEAVRLRDAAEATAAAASRIAAAGGAAGLVQQLAARDAEIDRLLAENARLQRELEELNDIPL